MPAIQNNVDLTKENILRDVLEILEDLTSDWETEFSEKIGPETQLVADLTFESLDVVQLSVALEEHFGRRKLPFQKLVTKPDGSYVDDLKVRDLVDFLHNSLKKA
ncbi:MAG: acyl carrier protein [bacterium]